MYEFYVLNGKLCVEPELRYIDLIKLTPAELKSVVVDKWACLLSYHTQYPEALVPNGVGETTCAYCYLYLNDACKSCPVFKVTGETGCRETPFVQYADAYYDDLDWEHIITACQAELDFLLSLE